MELCIAQFSIEVEISRAERATGCVGCLKDV